MSLDMKKVISMDEYARSLGKLKKRNGSSYETLTREELKVYRIYIGKLNWLVSNTRPELSEDVMICAREQKRPH